MDFKIFFSTFLLIFLAELGDKTQLAALSLSAEKRTPLSIFLGAMFAFLVSTSIAVFLGTVGSKIIPTAIIQKISAISFIAIGILILFKKI